MITGILLAAGSGSRFGGGKLLHPLADGTPIGVASLRNLRAALPEVVAVVRNGDDALRELLEAEGIAVRICPDAHLGMARSLVCGIDASRDANGWVIALGDMPFVLPQTINTVVERIVQSGRIAIPAYRGQRGHPVAFGRRYLDELLRLAGDEGARSVIGRHPRDLDIVDCNDPGILRDIDTAADLDRPAG
ncbi:MAG: nucleotidyltransferase family protein [Betaproteobacteria bacterium]|nr:nucleotidyltransferase family protein [Betaproteobacteria bacterium]